MQQVEARVIARRRTLRTSALLALIAASCNSSTSVEVAPQVAGTYETAEDGSRYFVDPHFQGLSTEVRIAGQFYGRLVAIEAFDSSGARVRLHESFVVNPQAETGWDPVDHVLETNPVTGEQVLLINAVFDDTSAVAGQVETGAARFQRLLRAADQGLIPIRDGGFAGAGSFSMVPNNAAVVVVFDDLIDSETLNNVSVQVTTGVPSITPFEARVFLDPSHGGEASFDGVRGAEFYSTRAIVDVAVSELDSFRAPAPLSVNLQGLPPSRDVNLSNVEVRIPTASLAGQTLPILQNPSGHGLTTSSNGSFDLGGPTRDVVRAFRSGGRTEVTGDANNGFLPDVTPPRLVGRQSIVIEERPALDLGAPRPLSFRLPRVTFTAETCATDPRPGDLIAITPFFAEVTEARSVANGVALDLPVRLVALPDDFLGPEQFEASGIGPADFRTAFDPERDAERARCFVRAEPTPLDPEDPTRGILPSSVFSVRFNEAIDPDRLEPYAGLGLTRRDPNDGPLLATDHVPGTITNDANLEVFTFRPVLELAHVRDEEESYTFLMGDGPRGPRDLAGNEILAVPGPVTFQLAADQPTVRSGGRVSLFDAIDEEFPFADPSGAGLIAQTSRPEWFGNIEYDLVRGLVRPRSVVRSRVTVSQDPSNTMVSQMFQGTGTSLPLNPLGARTQFVWRYLDVGLPLHVNRTIDSPVDMTALDLDIERSYLSPVGSQVVFEDYGEFQMSLSHALATPNEVVNAARQLADPNSGVGANFDANSVSLIEDAPLVVSSRERGYRLEPGDLEVASDGTPLLPLPMNVGIPVEQYETYTWRDTGIDARGGTSAFGTPVSRYAQLTGIQAFTDGGMCLLPGIPNPLYATGDVRTAGLPLLFDLRCYPSVGTSSQNLFNHAWAHVVPFSNPAVTTNLPGFRAYSAGGENQAGAQILIDPDSQTTALGGFNPASTPPGAALPGVDNVVYFGALDLVTRVSRMHSIFFPAYAADQGPDLTPENLDDNPTYGNPTYHEPVVVPALQPDGTAIQFEYRVARQVAGPDGSVLSAEEATWASRMDPYGDFYATTPINFTPPLDDGGVNSDVRGASCFDGSFQYLTVNENPGVAGSFAGGSESWTADLDQISGVDGDWIQVRVTFLNNIATGQFPELSALGLSWSQP